MSKLTLSKKEKSFLLPTLCLTQIVSWGGLYYSLSVLGQAIASEMKWTFAETYGGLSFAILTAGCLSPTLGLFVSWLGPLRLMAAGFTLGAVAFVIIGHSSNSFLYLSGWILAGVAMMATLYDCAFLVVAQVSHSQVERRRRVALIAIAGGFASAVIWPILGYLQGIVSWRFCFYGLAVLFVLLSLWIFWLSAKVDIARPKTTVENTKTNLKGKELNLLRLIAAFGLQVFVGSAVMIQFFNIFQKIPVAPGALLLASTLIGSTQVIGRILDLGPLRRFSARTLIASSLTGMGFSFLFAYLCESGSASMLIAFTLIFGSSNGLLTVARGIYVLDYFGAEGASHAMGWISGAGWFSRAAGPLALTYALDVSLPKGMIFLSLALLMVLSLVFFYSSTRG